MRESERTVTSFDRKRETEERGERDGIERKKQRQSKGDREREGGRET
mgnify:CR=1 FL=1